MEIIHYWIDIPKSLLTDVRILKLSNPEPIQLLCRTFEINDVSNHCARTFARRVMETCVRNNVLAEMQTEMKLLCGIKYCYYNYSDISRKKIAKIVDKYKKHLNKLKKYSKKMKSIFQYILFRSNQDVDSLALNQKRRSRSK